MPTNGKPRNFLWPSVDTVEDATWATKQAVAAAIFCAVVTALAAILAMCGVEFVTKTLKMSGWSLIDAAIFGVIALFLYTKHSRVAAWIGFVAYAGERVYMWVTVPSSLRSPFLAIFIILAFIAGIRGTTALHRMKTTPPQEPQKLVA